MKKHTLIFALLITTVTGTALYARQAVKPPVTSKSRLVNFTAELMRQNPLPSGESFASLNGDVVIYSEDSTLHTEKATYNGETQIATAPTRLRLEDKQNTLSADKGIAYYSTRDADFTGGVVINARPKQGDGTTAPKGSLRRNFKDPVTITCEKVRYNWRTKKAVLTGNLIIKQTNRTITGDRGLYDGVAETVTLIGNIKSRRPTGETGDAPGNDARAVACFTEGKEYFEVTRDPNLKAGKVRAVVPVREKEGGDVEVIEDATTPPPKNSPPTPADAPSPMPSATPEPPQ